MSGWLDGWQRVDNPRSGGGTYDPDGEGYPWRIVLHTIEGRNFPNTAAHQYPPQLWYNPATRAKIQTIPLDRAGFALYQGSSAPYYTNRARAIQVELVGFAEEAGSWPDEYSVNIAQDVVVPIVEWVRSQGGDIDLSDVAVPLPGAIPNSAREDAPQRLDPNVWAFGPIGLCGHRHVPMGDDHWDTGSLDLRRIAAYARELLGTSGNAGTITPRPKPGTPALSEEDEPMRQYRDVSTGTVYAVAGLFKTPLESDAVRQSWMAMGILLPPDQFFEQNAQVLSELPTVDQTTFMAMQSGINGGYANLNASLSEAQRKLEALGGMIAGLGKSATPAPAAAPADKAAVLQQATVAELVAALNEKTKAA